MISIPIQQGTTAESVRPHLMRFYWWWWCWCWCWCVGVGVGVGVGFAGAAIYFFWLLILFVGLYVFFRKLILILRLNGYQQSQR